MSPDSSFRLLLDRMTRSGTLLVMVVSALAICRWLFDAPVLPQWLPKLTDMKLNTALTLLAAALSLWLLHTQAPQSVWYGVARALAGFVVLVAGLNLAEEVFSLELGIDQLIAKDLTVALDLRPGRMSYTASGSLIFIGAALLTLRARRASLAARVQWLVVPPLAVSGLAFFCYTYGVSALYEATSPTSMAAYTALSILVLSLAILASDSKHGFASIASSDTAGGMVSRRLLPTIPVMIFALGWLCLAGQNLALYETRFAFALMVSFSIAVCVMAVASAGITLHRVDNTRKQAEAEILSLNAGLELRVQQRTRELAQVTSQLQLVNVSLELLSQQDGLTGLANRRYFDRYLADQIAIARRYGRTLALMLCDVDSFKAYNDHYGHQAGDECLKQIAAALRSCCRRSADVPARYGGEEFAIIFPDTELTHAVEMAEAAGKAVLQLNIANEKSAGIPFISISSGVAVTRPNAAMSARDLILLADQRLFEAKRLGRNRVVSADVPAPAMRAERASSG
jgi:diguanylate cyclase (GGDEF)-like protein